MASDETGNARIEALKSKLDAYTATEGEGLSNKDWEVCGDPCVGEAQNTIAQAPGREIRPGQAGPSSDIPKELVDEHAGKPSELHHERCVNPAAGICYIVMVYAW